MKTVWIFSLMSAALCAQRVQNMDISFMFGPVKTSGVIVANPNGSTAALSGSVGFSSQINYGYQVVTTDRGNLYVEIPMTWVWHPSGSVTNGTVEALDRSARYFTPGVRFKIPTGTRVSFYGALGGGVAAYSERDSVVSGRLVASTSTSSFHPVLDFGGGIDLRISRWLSLRADGRDFISSHGLGGTVGRNHLQFLAGIAFHF